MAQLFAARLGAPMTERTKRLLAWRARLARRPAVRLIVRQFIKTLQGAGKPAPPFMHEAMADRGKTPPVRGHPA
jgi:glutathione S-transferase